MSVSEKEWIISAQAGDRQAFDRICQIYRQDIYGLCFRFLNNREEAQDVVQEVLSRAWQRLDTFRGEASFRTWLWEIGRNLCLNRLRARRSQRNQQTIPMEAMSSTERQQTLELPDSRPTPEEVVLDAAQRAQMRQEIARCAADKKWEASDWELFLLRIEHNISYAEFAQRQGRDEAYWRNRWRDKIKPVLERVRNIMNQLTV